MTTLGCHFMTTSYQVVKKRQLLRVNFKTLIFGAVIWLSFYGNCIQSDNLAVNYCRILNNLLVTCLLPQQGILFLIIFIWVGAPRKLMLCITITMSKQHRYARVAREINRQISQVYDLYLMMYNTQANQINRRILRFQTSITTCGICRSV